MPLNFGLDLGPFQQLLLDTIRGEKDQLMFVTDPFKEDFEINGAITANVRAMINKKDIDQNMTAYKQFAGGKYLALNSVVQRASLARDRSKRQLLKPGVVQTIDINHNYITGVKMEKGSRLIILLNMNKNPAWQINYGSGKDVSDETMADAAEPFDIRWYNTTEFKVPVWQ